MKGKQEFREHRIMVSFDDDQYKKLKEYSKETGVPMAFAVYRAATKGPVLEKLIEIK